MRTAYLFPGQGAQVVGMGCDIVKVYPAAADVFEKANSILGYDLRKICFEGPPEVLNSTTRSQPAIFVTSAALLEALKQNGKDVKPDVTTGLSMGQYTALYAAGVVSFEDGLVLSQRRGEAMQAAADATEGSMVSIIGLDEAKVRELCEKASEGDLLEPVNFNCPGQIVISGAKAACRRAERLAVEFGAIKAIELAVAGAFHTKMMAGAVESLRKDLSACSIREPKDIKILADTTAEYYKTADEIKEGLLRQLTSPILWQKCMERLIAEGIEIFYEIGPSRVLAGLMKRINRKAKVININGLEAVKETVRI